MRLRGAQTWSSRGMKTQASERRLRSAAVAGTHTKDPKRGEQGGSSSAAPVDRWNRKRTWY